MSWLGIISCMLLLMGISDIYFLAITLAIIALFSCVVMKGLCNRLISLMIV